MIEISTWQVITFFITLFISMLGMMIGFGKMLLMQFDGRIREQFSGADKTREQQFKALEDRFDSLEPRFTELDRKVTFAKENQVRINEKVHELELRMSNDYQRREDAIRADVANTARYDAINAKLDRVILATTVKTPNSKVL